MTDEADTTTVQRIYQRYVLNGLPTFEEVPPTAEEIVSRRAAVFGAVYHTCVAFAFLYGACNGILTITRGTLPLVLFGHRSYGRLVGTLIVPSFILWAAAPLIYAVFMDWLGDSGALSLSTGIALVTLMAAALLKLLFASKSRTARL